MQYYSPLQLKLLICLPSVLGLFRIYKVLQLSNLSFPRSRGKKPTNPHNQRTLLFSGHTCFECLLTVEVIQEMKIALLHLMYQILCFVCSSQKFHICNQTQTSILVSPRNCTVALQWALP